MPRAMKENHVNVTRPKQEGMTVHVRLLEQPDPEPIPVTVNVTPCNLEPITIHVNTIETTH